MARAVTLAMAAQASAKLLERNQIHREDWSVRAQAQGFETHEVTFAVKQLNLDALEKALMEVSMPDSPKRGQYLSYEEVHSMTANPSATEAVLSWLQKAGVNVNSIHKHGHFIKAQTNVSTWEKLLSTKFAFFQSAADPTNVVLRAQADVHVPDELADALEGVFMTTQLPPRLRQVQQPKYIREAGASSDATPTKVTPAGLKSFYHVTDTGSSAVSQSVFETGQYVSPKDLTTFEQEFNLPSEAIATDIGGHESAFMCALNPNNCAEANLDVQYQVALSANSPETYWYDSNQNTPFEDWIEQVAAATNPPLVNSISYGSLEPEMSPTVMNTFNTEAMKLGAQGVTIFVSSGDDGVANFQARGDASKCAYTPSFPATSPYVTAVGATQGGVNGGAEIACSEVTGGQITTGGGFSTNFDAPSWQKEAISNYFSAVSTQPVSGYAASGRGYPDVAMNGFDYEVVIGGSIYGVSGTSASSPVVSGMASLVNGQLAAAGKPSMGFINPTLYAAGSSSFNDITSGDNKGTASSVVCSQGFYAAKGWDPLTGMGSVDYEKFKSLFVSSAVTV